MDEPFLRRCKVVKELIESPLFEAAIEGIRDDIKNEMVKTKPEEVEVRNRLHLEHSVVDRVVGRLTVYANNYIVEGGGDSRRYG